MKRFGRDELHSIRGPTSVLSAAFMKIPIIGKIPRSYGPPPLQKGAIGGFLGVGPDPLRLIFMRGVLPSRT